MCTLTYATPTFITEALHLVIEVQLALMTVTRGPSCSSKIQDSKSCLRFDEDLKIWIRILNLLKYVFCEIFCLLISTLNWSLKQRSYIQSLCTSLLRRRDIQSLSLFSDFSVAHSYSYIGLLASYLAMAIT